jgi:2-oxoglutarate dehydrogenase complex dehydrogenase (E1) component-like enzyme
VRIEQFYPFKGEELKKIIDGYTSADKIVWVQEEPRNMGAWNFLSGG